MYSKEPALNCFIIAAAYVTARAMCDGSHVIRCGAVLNPAIGFGAQMTQLFAGTTSIKYIWIFMVLPFGGAFVAVLFHDLVFKKTQEVLGTAQDDEDALLEK